MSTTVEINMAPKRPNLTEIAQASGSTRRQPVKAEIQPVPLASDLRREAPARTATRVGTKQVAAHLPEEVSWQLRMLAVEQRTSVQELLGEALNDLFQKYGKPELLPRRAARN
jgi:hypothetical protein